MDSKHNDAEDIERIVREFIADSAIAEADLVTARGKVFDAGFSRVEFPLGLGGRGWQRNTQRAVNRILSEEAGFVPVSLEVSPIAIGMAAPTLAVHGQESVRAARLREIYTGEAKWCQMFSEPSAGSDVAGLSTRAVPVEGGWQVNGQKVWTSYVLDASYALLLARTDPSKPKHQGLSYFYLDMTSPGVTVRPLYQITGDSDFNEIFLDDVFVPAENLLGGEGQGWKVANTTLMNERDALGGMSSLFTADTILTFKERKEELGELGESLRDQLVQLWMEDIAIALITVAARRNAIAGRMGPEGSVAKQASAELQQRVSVFELELEGAAGLVIPEGYTPKPETSTTKTSAQRRYLGRRALTIAGGTSEVQRNILAERVLRMPPDLRADKDVPWDQIPRG